MVEIHIDYEGQLHTRAVHVPSGAEVATDAPVDNEGRGGSFSPTDLVATALGSCLLTIIGIVARRKGLEVTGATANVVKIMSDDLPRRIARLPVTIALPLPADHPDRPMIEAAALSCPVNSSLRAEIDRPVTFLWEG
ncbi:MAG: putative redox protein [Verrucomicrobiales bacterium]|jgi:putative redox protein